MDRGCGGILGGHATAAAATAKIYVFRLSDLDELIDDEDYTLNNVLNVPTWEPRSKEDMVKNAIECSKGAPTQCSSLKLTPMETAKTVYSFYSLKCRHALT